MLNDVRSCARLVEVSIDDVEYVLSHFEERRDAPPIPNQPASEIFVATVRGNRLQSTWRRAPANLLK
jgi:hypothetical protein